MKKHILTTLFLISLAAGFCTTKRKFEKPGVSQLPTHKEAIETLPAQQAQQLPATAVLPDTLFGKETEQLLKQSDLSNLWLLVQEEEAPVYNGFYGTDNYRIEFYFASIQKDSVLAHVYHVKGKSRYKKNITPFEGNITIDSISNLGESKLAAKKIYNSGLIHAFTSIGTFEFREDSTFQGSGLFKGKMAMDFGVSENNELEVLYFPDTDSQEAGCLFKGQWHSYTTGRTKPVLCAKYLLNIADNILENFDIGERDVEINPKYRHLGWDDYWSNEEWWNETPGVL